MILTTALTAYSLYPLSAIGQSLEAVCAGELRSFSLPPFAAFDENEDDALDEREVSDCEALSMLFPRLDLNADDVLTSAEYDGFATVWTRRLRTFDDLE